MDLPARHSTSAAAVTLVLAAGVLTGCTGSNHGRSAATTPAASPTATTAGPARTTRRVPTPEPAGVVAGDFRTPWGLAFLPGGDAVVAERDTGRVKRVTAAGKVRTIGTVPGVVPGG